MRSSALLSPPLARALLAAAAGLALCAPALAAASTTPAAAAESRAAVLSAGIAKITGLAISPLVVLVVLGAADFLRLGGFDAAPGALPLHANPWVLGPCLLVLVLATLKKCASPAIPLPIRKALDAAEYIEAKLSALVAAGVLLPTIVSTMAAADAVVPGDPQVAGFAGGMLGTAVLAIGAVALFGAVWITFHAIDALILLSPFAIVDAMLVAARAAILALIGLAFLISPFLALLLCIPLIIACFLVAGWCIRLDLFALSVATDILFQRRGELDRTRAFLAARGHGAPIRTMGRAEPAPEGIRFTYRPLFVLPRRTLVLRADRPELVRGLLWSTMWDDARAKALVSFPPRHAHHADALAARFGARTRDGLMRRAIRGIGERVRATAAFIRGESPERA